MGNSDFPTLRGAGFGCETKTGQSIKGSLVNFCFSLIAFCPHYGLMSRVSRHSAWGSQTVKSQMHKPQLSTEIPSADQGETHSAAPPTVNSKLRKQLETGRRKIKLSPLPFSTAKVNFKRTTPVYLKPLRDTEQFISVTNSITD